MYERLLLPTDGGEETGRAGEHAVALARAFDARVHVLSVVDTRNRFESPTAGVAADAWVEAERERAETAVAAVESDLPADVETVTAVREGVPHAAIVEYAETADVDAVVMATHGRTGLDRYLIGSVTEKVVRTSPAPVLTVGTAEEA